MSLFENKSIGKICFSNSGSMINIKDNSRITSTISKSPALQKNKYHPVQQSQNRYNPVQQSQNKYNPVQQSQNKYTFKMRIS